MGAIWLTVRFKLNEADTCLELKLDLQHCLNAYATAVHTILHHVHVDHFN